MPLSLITLSLTRYSSLCVNVRPDKQSTIKVFVLPQLVCSVPQPVNIPSSGVSVEPKRHILQKFHLLGWVQLHDVELNDDEKWPLSAIGHDLDMQFAPPRGRGRTEITLISSLSLAHQVLLLAPTMGRFKQRHLPLVTCMCLQLDGLLCFSLTTWEWRIV